MAQTAVDLVSEPVNRVAKKLACTCGCAQDMTCQMEPGCGICKRAKTRIFAEQQAGKSDSQILDGFVAENGKTILWVTPGLAGSAGPYVALSLGAIVVLFVIRRYLKPRPAGMGPEIDPEVLDKINKDMAKLD
jgi:cytochrome c-type biogenesis protein CcmH/NrfF